MYCSNFKDYKVILFESIVNNKHVRVIDQTQFCVEGVCAFDLKYHFLILYSKCRTLHHSSTPLSTRSCSYSDGRHNGNTHSNDALTLTHPKATKGCKGESRKCAKSDYVIEGGLIWAPNRCPGSYT